MQTEGFTGVKFTSNREYLLKMADEVGRLAAKELLQADEDARLSDTVIKKIKEVGFHKLLRPKQYGGQYVDYETYGEIIRTVSKHSVAAGWLVYFFSIHETWAAFLPKEGRDELFQQGGLMADVIAPVGNVKKDSDNEGYRLSGQWNFCSGVLWSDWIGLGAVLELPDSKEAEYCLLIVHKDDVEILYNWNTLGLRGSGSNAVIAKEVYVPLRRIFPAARVLNGAGPVDGTYDDQYQIFNIPFMAMFLIGFQHVAIGGIERLIEIFQERTEKRLRIFKNNENEKEAPSSQRVLAELKIQLSSLKGLSNEYCQKLSYYEKMNIRVLNEEDREKLFAIRAYISKTAAEMALKIILTLGGNSVFKGDPTEMFVRDLITTAAHPNHHYEDAMAGYGKSIFGFQGNPIW